MLSIAQLLNCSSVFSTGLLLVRDCNKYKHKYTTNFLMSIMSNLDHHHAEMGNGRILKWAELLSITREIGSILVFVVNPSRSVHLHQEINRNTWRKLSVLPFVMQNFLISSSRVKCDPEFFCALLTTTLSSQSVEYFLLVEVSGEASPDFRVLELFAKGCLEKRCFHPERWRHAPCNHVRQRVIRLIRYFCRETLKAQSKAVSRYVYNPGPGGVERTFQLLHGCPDGSSVPLNSLVENDISKFRLCTRGFSGHYANLKHERPCGRTCILKATTTQHLDANWQVKIKEYRHRLKHTIQSKLYDLSLVEEIFVVSCKVVGYKPYRSQWLEVFPTICMNDPMKPCTLCRQCRIRMCQAAMVVLAAQGVADKLILPHLGAVFRHPRYCNWSIEEWVLVPISELAAIFRTGSKHCLNAYHFHYFLLECVNCGPPLCLHDIVSLKGFSKKSGCLFLKAVVNVDFGIPTDSHVYEASLALGWIERKKGIQEELASYMLEQWVPRVCWEWLNVWLAGIRQMMSINSSTSAKVSACAESLGKNHTRILASIAPRLQKECTKTEYKQFLHEIKKSWQFVINSESFQKERLTTFFPEPPPQRPSMLQQDIRFLMKK
jgi:hypothetical protein